MENIYDELKSIVEKLGVEERSIYAMEFHANFQEGFKSTVVIYCYDLKDGKPYLNAVGTDAEKQPAKIFSVQTCPNQGGDIPTT